MTNATDPLVAVCVLVLAILIDLSLGEPPSKWRGSRYELHPTVWIGKLTKTLEPHFKNPHPKIERLNGAVLALLVISIFVFPVYFGLRFIYALFGVYIYTIIAAIILKMSFCIKLETEFALKAVRVVEADNLIEGRKHVALHFSRRDTRNLSGPQIVSAVVESIAENLTDFKLSSIFYYAFLGVPGAVAFRIVNTLDGTVGFKDPEHIHIGWFSAMLDTIANYVPARLTTFLIILASAILGEDYRNSWRVAHRDKAKVPSVNHGWPMAAIAGALHIQLEKPDYYVIGDDIEEISPRHIIRALRIRNTVTILFIILLLPILFLIRYPVFLF